MPLAAVAAVLRNASLRRVLIAFAGFSLAEWGTWIAILVYAFERGGATEAGVVALIQLAPSALVAPVAATLGDRVRRDRALLTAYVVQCLAMGATAAALISGLPSPLVYVAAAVVATSITLTRPIQAAILPSLARTPAELTAANVVAGAVETGSMLAGPLIAGLVLAAFGAGPVFAGSAAVTLAGAALVFGIRPIDGEASELPTDKAVRQVVGELFAGFAMLTHDERPRSIMGLLGAAAILWGVLDIFLVVLAIDLLAMGEAGVGYLNAAIGAGGLVGSGLSVLLIGRTRLALPFGLGLLVWGVALTAVGLLPSVAMALVLLCAAGIGGTILDVSGRTLLQRVTPDETRARVFGVLEGIQMGSLAIGSIAAPVLIGLAGPTGAIAAAGCALILVTAVGWRQLVRADAFGLVRSAELAVLRRLPIFAPLSGDALERLAARVVPRSNDAGATIIRQGDAGDWFYIITSGAVDISVDGRIVGREGPGESFGEIALLRRVPRTATVVAAEPTELLALSRRDFLEAVTRQPASAAAAEAVVRSRLADKPDADA